MPQLARKDDQSTLQVLLTLAYTISQNVRKRFEDIFCWVKAPRGCRKSRDRGVERPHAHSQSPIATLNLLRIAGLMSTAPPKTARA